MNCPQCQTALQPGAKICPACNAEFASPVTENEPVQVREAQDTAAETPTAASLLVQQVSNVTGVPAAIVPTWRRFKPVALVAFLAPMGLIILIGLLLTGDIYKPEQGTQFFQPLSQGEKIRLAAVAGIFQVTVFVLLLSI